MWGHNNLAFNTGVQLVANQDVHSQGISDRGTTRSIISLAEAKRLRERGTISSIDWVPIGSSKEEPVIATIRGKGLLTTIAVVENVEATLIADTDFTRHGIILLQDDTTIVGIYGKEIVFRGVRDSNAMSGTSDQLWLLDMDTLLLQSAPTACATVETADDLATMLTQRHGHDDGEQNESFAGRARPTWSKQAVRLARQVIENFNNTAPRMIMKTIPQGAWRNVPDALDSKILMRLQVAEIIQYMLQPTIDKNIEEVVE